MNETNNPAQPPAARKLTRRDFITRAAVGAVALAGVDVGSRIDERDWLEVTHTDVAVRGWPSRLDGFTIGHLADFHCHGEHSRARIERAVSMLLREKPQLVALTGDFVSSGMMVWMEPCAKALAPLAAVPFGAYAVLGNHDWWHHEPDAVVEALGLIGVRLLRNQSVKLADLDLCITGIDDVWMGQDDLGKAATTAPPARHRLLLVHEPDFADIAGPGFDLQLSGHSHGGQIRIPGLPAIHTPVLARHYIEGLEQSRTHPVYTTRGIGTTGLPIRYHCPPEITLIHLRSTSV